MKFDAQKRIQKYDHHFDMKDAKSADWKKAPQKAKSDGVYYLKPERSMWYGESKDGSYYYYSLLSLAPNADFTFRNMSNDAANCKWTWRDMEFEGDENGDLSFGQLDCYQTNGYNNMGEAPILTKGDISYTLGDLNQRWCDYYTEMGYNISSHGMQMFIDTLENLSFIDYPHSIYSGAWGIVHPDEKTSWLFGNGKVNDDGSSYTVAAISQIFPNPHGLYVNSVYSNVYTMSKPLTANAQLTMTFYKVVEQDGKDVISDEVIGVFYATPETQTLIDGPYSSKSSNSETGSFTSTDEFYIYNVEFTNEEYDPIMGSFSSTPVVLNDKFAVVISGFDQAGVDVNFLGSAPYEEENITEQTNILVWADDTKSGMYSYGYQAPLIVDLTFESLFDYVEVLETGYLEDGTEVPSLNILKVSADGETITNEELGEGVVIVYTGYPWQDDQSIDNYYCELPSWISELAFQEVDPVTQNTNQGPVEFRDGRVYLAPVCDPLPAGVSGRYALLYLEGKGYISKEPIIVLQGDAKLEDITELGIEAINTTNAKNDSKVYNMMGQPVNDSFKGLIIKDGKKQIVK